MRATNGSRLTSLESPQDSLLSLGAEWLASHFFPEQCLECGCWGKGYLCTNCQPASGPHTTTFAWGKVVSVGPYEGCLRKFVLHWKEFGSARICREAAKLSSRLWRTQGPLDAGVVLLPVPASRSRSRFRGHRPVEQWAVEMGRVLGLRCHPDMLEAVNDLSERKRLNLSERQNDGDHIYRCKDLSVPRNSHLLLLDDVVTSGETLRRAKLALTQAGFSRVSCLAFCAANKILP